MWNEQAVCQMFNSVKNRRLLLYQKYQLPAEQI